MKVLGGVGSGNDIDTVLDLASVAVVLAFHACSVRSTFGGSCFIDTANRIRLRMLGGNDALTLVSQTVMVPADGFEKPLQGSRCNILIQCHRLDVLSLHVAK